MNNYGTYIVKKAGDAIFSIFLISVAVFLLVHLMPGDPVRAMLGYEADEAAVQAARETLHLNDPLIKQYFIWAGNFLKGDFGQSLVLKTDIFQTIATRIPVSLSITLPAFVISTVIGIVVGTISATHRGSFADQSLTVFVTAFGGVPDFWIGIMLMFIFSVKLGILPAMGYVSPWEDMGGYLKHAALPVLVLTITSFVWIGRQMRTCMLDVLNQDYIRTARANGLPASLVHYKHGMRNTLIPVVTLLVLQVRSLVGGSLLIKQVFSIAGMGRLIYTSVASNDYLTIQALTMIIAVFVIACNLLLDLSYGFMDPRIRARGKRS